MNSADEKGVRPFVFEQSFDMLLDEDEVALKKEEEEEEVPTFSEEELQAAREAAYQEGMQAGLQQAMDGIKQQVSATLEVVGATLGRIDEQQEIANKMIARETVDLAIAALEKLLPELAREGAAAEVEGFVQGILTQILEEPKIAVTVSEELAGELEPHLIDLAARIGFAGAIVVVGDASLGPADCRIRWSEGDAERLLENTRREIAALTDSVPKYDVGTLEVNGEAQMPAPMPEPTDGLPERAEGNAVAEAKHVESETAPEVETTVEAEPIKATETMPPTPGSNEGVMDASAKQLTATQSEQGLPKVQGGTAAEMPTEPA